MNVIVLLRIPHKDPQSADAISRLSPCDRAALQLALDIDPTDRQITVITVGPPQDETVLSLALAAGADRAIRIWDSSIDHSDLYFLSFLLSAGIKHVGFDLVIAGHRSADWGTGATGPMVAHFLDIPHLTSICEVKREEKQLRCRHLDGQSILSILLPTPLLLTASAAPLRPFQNRTETPEIEHLSVEDLDVQLATKAIRALPSIKEMDPAAPVLCESPEDLLDKIKQTGLLP